MKVRHYLLGATAAIGLAVAAASAEAPPTVATAGDLTSAVREASNVDQVYRAAAAGGTEGISIAGAIGLIMAYAASYYDPYPYSYRLSIRVFHWWPSASPWLISGPGAPSFASRGAPPKGPLPKGPLAKGPLAKRLR